MHRRAISALWKPTRARLPPIAWVAAFTASYSLQTSLLKEESPSVLRCEGAAAEGKGDSNSARTSSAEEKSTRAAQERSVPGWGWSKEKVLGENGNYVGVFFTKDSVATLRRSLGLPDHPYEKSAPPHIVLHPLNTLEEGSKFSHLFGKKVKISLDLGECLETPTDGESASPKASRPTELEGIIGTALNYHAEEERCMSDDHGGCSICWLYQEGPCGNIFRKFKERTKASEFKGTNMASDNAAMEVMTQVAACTERHKKYYEQRLNSIPSDDEEEEDGEEEDRGGEAGPDVPRNQ